MPATVIVGAPRRRLGGAAEKVARAELVRPFDPHCAAAYLIDRVR